MVYGKTIETHPNLFRDIKVFFNHQSKKFIVTSKQIDDCRTFSQGESVDTAEQDGKNPNSVFDFEKQDVKLHFLLLKEKEANRYFQGVLVGGAQPLIFQVEQAIASGGLDEKCIRISVCKILDEENHEKLIDFIIADPNLLTA